MNFYNVNVKIFISCFFFKLSQCQIFNKNLDNVSQSQIIRHCLCLHVHLNHLPHTPNVHCAQATLASVLSANMPSWLPPLTSCPTQCPGSLTSLIFAQNIPFSNLYTTSLTSSFIYFVLFRATMLFLYFIVFIFSLFLEFQLYESY